ncbi:MAG TPA: hypothetical protein VFT67_18290 [Jatrophihabitantaceae bacterium]|nr:hypothetical protein [Jatrophihabitantaceae bacterium]
MVTRTVRLGVIAALAAAVAGCAAQGSAGGPRSVDPTATASCERFEVSIAGRVTGAPTPEQAATRFLAGGSAWATWTPSGPWHRIPDGPGGLDGLKLRSGQVTLHAIEVPVGGWAIDGGARCR